MPASPYIRDLRAAIGSRLLLLPAVAAVIHDDEGRVLLLMTIHGVWSLPAGAIDPGEDPRTALTREVLEETGLRVVPARLLDVVGGEGFRVRYPNGDLIEPTVCVFGCDVVGGELRCDGVETTHHAWVEPAEVPARLTLPYPPSLFVRRSPRGSP